MVAQAKDLWSLVLDRHQLRDISMDDEELMRELLTALIDNTEQQFPLLESAIRERDPRKCRELAHYSKGACANVGANAAAAVLKRMEQQATRQAFQECGISLANLADEIDRLRHEAF